MEGQKLGTRYLSAPVLTEPGLDSSALSAGEEDGGSGRGGAHGGCQAELGSAQRPRTRFLQGGTQAWAAGA